jgi:hypothetical protein
VEIRYAVALRDGTIVGYVLLRGAPPGDQIARLQPLPAFRVAREPRRLYKQFRRLESEHRSLTNEDMLVEERALAACAEIALYLAKLPSSVLVPNASVSLLPGEPPHVRVRFRVAEDAPSE